jgi:hypothetical protein
MSRPLPEETVHAVQAFFRQVLDEAEEAGDESVWLAIEAIDPIAYDEDWQLAPPDDVDAYDLYELFGELSDEFLIEEEGGPSFYVSRKTND